MSRDIGVYNSLGQRVRSQAVCAVQTCARALAQDIESADRALAIIVYLHTATAVVRCRAYRNHIFGDVNANREALLVDVREVVLGLLGRHVCNIEVDKPDPAHALVGMLAARGMTVATAESCTGGLIAKKLTDVAGCSAVVAGGAVTYQTREKEQILGVDPALIAAHTVVSEAVVKEMAQGALARFGVDLAIATTGYAGPGGGTEKEPVGTVYVAVATKDAVDCQRLTLGTHRDRAYVREVAAVRAIAQAIGVLGGNLQKS